MVQSQAFSPSTFNPDASKRVEVETHHQSKNRTFQNTINVGSGFRSFINETGSHHAYNEASYDAKRADNKIVSNMSNTIEPGTDDEAKVNVEPATVKGNLDFANRKLTHKATTSQVSIKTQKV